MPWKVNGQRWHLSDKGFPPGRKMHWDRALLPRLLEIVHEVEPNLRIEWDVRDTIKFYVPGVGRAWAQWRTKDTHGLDCKFMGKKGQLNLSRVEDFGVEPSVTAKESGDLLKLVFQRNEHVHAPRLKELLTEHLAGFREAFAKAKV